MRKKITDISDTGGEIHQILDQERFIKMVKNLGIIDEKNITQDDVEKAQDDNKAKFIEKTKAFAECVNQEYQKYVRKHEAQKITAISDPGREIYQMVKELGIVDETNTTQDDLDKAQVENKSELIEKKIKGFAKLANQELHEYVKNRELLDRKKDARDNKRIIDFPSEIEKSARDFRELVKKAPIAIANNTELVELSEQLEAVPHIFNELRQNDNITELLTIDHYAGKYTDSRVYLVLGMHAAYKHFTGNEDWVTFDAFQSEYTNSFFKLLRLFYQDAGINLSDSSIERDITNARKAG